MWLCGWDSVLPFHYYQAPCQWSWKYSICWHPGNNVKPSTLAPKRNTSGLIVFLVPNTLETASWIPLQNCCGQGQNQNMWIKVACLHQSQVGSVWGYIFANFDLLMCSMCYFKLNQQCLALMKDECVFLNTSSQSDSEMQIWRSCSHACLIQIVLF